MQEAACEEASVAGSGEDREGAPGEGPAASPFRVTYREEIIGYRTIVITITLSIIPLFFKFKWLRK